MRIYLAQIYLSINKKDMEKYIEKTDKITSILESYHYINKKMDLIKENIGKVQ